MTALSPTIDPLSHKTGLPGQSVFFTLYYLHIITVNVFHVEKGKQNKKHIKKEKRTRT